MTRTSDATRNRSPRKSTEPTPEQADRLALQRLRDISPVADPRAQIGVRPAAVPTHIAIIMDGNGRWASNQNLPRHEGHRAGAPRVREVLRRAGELGVAYLTLYSFSSENWGRPRDEVAALMSLYAEHLASERHNLLENTVRFKQIGRRDALEPHALRLLNSLIEDTAHCTGITLVLAVDYSSRDEITRAAQAIARRAATGELHPDDIDQNTITQHLDTADMPDPDLLIRTAGEMRLSNYLLWQISYAELHITDTLWPDFSANHLDDAIRDYAGRSRRFGLVQPADNPATNPTRPNNRTAPNTPAETDAATKHP